MPRPIDRDSAWLLTAQVVYKGAGFVVLGTVGRLVREEQIGLFFFATGFVGPLVLLSHLGTNPLMSRRVAISGDGKDLRPFLALRLALGAAYLVVLGASAHLLAGPSWSVVIFVGIGAWLADLHGMFGSLFVAISKVKYNVIVGVAGQVVLLLAVAAILPAFPTALGMAAANVVFGSFLLVASLYLTHTRIAPLGVRWDRTIPGEGTPFLLILVGQRLTNHILPLVVGFIGTHQEVAHYALAAHVVDAAMFVPLTVGKVVFRSLAKAGVTASSRQMFRVRAAVILVVSVTAAALVVGAPELICRVLYGPDHGGVAVVLAWLAALVPLGYWSHFSSLALQALGHERLVTVTVYLGSIVTLGLSPYLVSEHGATGAAFAAVGGVAVRAAALALLAFRVGILVHRP